ncbi:tetratricopeptide repeat protein [Zoogloea sp.]|uniref:tetratricopeptide repeat protein n=1 Tax=Zoogloea sp. TaxID=49181 RepID=UPI00261E770E|nr:tetratricopeptide repeat protein [Zoogloea sp.]MDD3353223.1 tetratricopeptide repeat protein [Zoogloea sp.]
MSPRALVVFGVLVGLVFILMFPNPTLERSAIESRRGDLLTVAYLSNLLRTDPDNAELRFALASQQISRNETQAARDTLRPLLDSPFPQLRAGSHWRDWLSYRQAWLRAEEGSALKMALEGAMLARLRELSAEDWPEDMQISILQEAMALGERALVVDMLKRLAHRPGSAFDAGWYAEGARGLLAFGDYRGAAELFLLARQRATRLQARREHFLAAVHTLQAGNLLDEAIATAERELGDLGEDTETLYALVVLARACNRPDVADRLARRMIRLSLRDQWMRWLAWEEGRGGGVRPTAGEMGPPLAPPGLAFDERIYGLAYEAFVGNRNLADAYRVAESAVRQRPDDLAWRERLAQAAEWSGKPEKALEQWQVLATRKGSREAWEAILRLAPGLTDDAALLPALLWRYRTQGRDPAQLKEVIATYERLGLASEGVAFLQGEARGKASLVVLEALERLAERAGEVDLAIDTLLRIEAQAGPEPRRAERIVGLLVREGRVEEAFQALERARAVTPGDDQDFWRLHGEVAVFAEKKDAARDSYRRIVAFEDASALEFTRYIELLRESDPVAAAAMAEKAWHRLGGLDALLRVLDHYSELGRQGDIGRLLAGLDAGQRQEAEASVRFLTLRGRHHEQQGRRAQARQDYLRALRLQPAAEGVREALLWLLIDGNDTVTLRAVLASHEETWSADESLQDVLAAAWLALSRPQRALDRYYTPRVRAHQGDFLWMLTYSDALEQNGETERAWRLREGLWRQEQRVMREPSEEELTVVRRLARQRLARAARPGDGAHAVLREILRLDRKPGDALSPAARELVLAWFIDQGQMEGVRGFLWHQYGRNLARPLWAETTAALGSVDHPEAGRLLEQWDERLPRYDRVNLARLAGVPAVAASAAFEAMDIQRDDETSHLQLTEVMLDQADRTDLDLALRKLGSLEEQAGGLKVDGALGPQLRLAVELGSVSREILDRSYFSALPGMETLGMLRLGWRHDDGTTRIAVGRRESLESYTPILLEREQNLGRHLTLTVSAGRDQPATENAALRVAGLRDQLGVSLGLRLSVRDTLSLQLDEFRYRAQNGLPVGEARLWQAGYAHAFRVELPDLVGNLFASRYEADTDVNLADPRAADIKNRLFATTRLDATALAPQGFTLYGARLSSNLRLATDYTRAPRPFWSVGLLRNSVVGTGYDYALGVAGSLLGNDHLSAGFREDKGGTGTFARTRQFSLHYRYYY